MHSLEVFRGMLALLCTIDVVQAVSSPTWVSLNVSVPSTLVELEYNLNYVDVLVGTPPQVLSLPIDIQADAITVYSSECQFCGGTTFYDASQSSTSKNENRALNGTATLNGSWFSDTVGLGGLVQLDNIDLATIELLSTNFEGLRILNGGFGFLSGTPRDTSITRFVPTLYEKGQLLNPVVGMRLDTLNPKLTIGALDPNDYDGEINWVQVEPSRAGDNLYNQFKLDGIVGRNGSFVPWGDHLLGGLDTLFIGIGVPDNLTYISSPNFTGPVYNSTFNIDPVSGSLGIPCNNTQDFWGHNVQVPPAYMDFNVQINGVQYMVDNDEMVRNLTLNGAANGFCAISVSTNTVKGKPDVWLGLPFLRSVYLAYRFPMGDCPGYFGFAFPKGANRTQAQIAQKPTSTPAQMAQCLNLIAPTSTPVATRPSPDGGPKYAVYGHDDLQVPLKGTEFLKKGVWNVTT